MARPVVAPTARAAVLDPAALLAVALLAPLVAVVAWPVAALARVGMPALLAAPPLAAGVATLVVALTAALAALLAGGGLAFALARVALPGRAAAWRLVRLGVLVPPFVAPLALLVLGAPGGLLTVALAQALAFLPHAVVLLVRALAAVPIELEQVAETLGAPRRVVLHRVTLGLAGPHGGRAALLVLGLCLADVAAPLLLGGRVPMLATLIAGGATGGTAAAAALALLALAGVVALTGATWRLSARGALVLPPIDRRAPAALCWSAGAVVWLTLGALASLWVLVPLGSLLAGAGGPPGLSAEHWAALAAPAARRALAGSLSLGLGVAVAATLLGFAVAWAMVRTRGPLALAVGLLARLPAGVPGVVGGAGWLLLLGPPAGSTAGLVLVALVTCGWLPVAVETARRGLGPLSPAAAEAALSLGAERAVVLRRIVAPGLRPAAGGLLAGAFAAGVLALDGGVGLLGPGPTLGTLWMLTLAASAAPGAACALGTVLLVLAGGGMLLGRALAGRNPGFTPLA